MIKFINPYILLILLFITSNLIYAQKVRTCAAHEASTALMERDSNYAKNVEKNNRIATNSKNARIAAGPYTIPVVVHVLYNNATQNISDAQIQSQIDVLNQDYNLLNSNFLTGTPTAFQALAGNTQIHFALAKRDPNGKPTNGITRTATNVTSFTYNSGDKEKFTATGGHDAWDADKYLNIWVCNLSNALGFAYFPGGPKSIDGLTIAFECFGTTGTAKAPYHLGRTATHEIGHYLNLMHIWGDKSDCTGNDKVDDTPQHHDANYTCQTFPYKVCSSTTTNGEMYMNYMDYSPDICMSMFSQGQASRMISALTNSRATILTSDAAKPYTNKNDVGIFNILSPSKTENACGVISSQIELTNIGTDTLKSVDIIMELNGSQISKVNWTGKLPYLQSTTVSFDGYTFTNSNNKIRFYTMLPNNIADEDNSNDTISKELLNIKSTSLPLFESFESNTFPPTNWAISNPDNNITWEQSTAAGYVGTKSLVFKNFESTNLNDQHDEFVSPRFKCKSSSLSFYYAYKKYSSTVTPYDTLTVSISTDCGKTKTELFKKGGDNLVVKSPSFTTIFYVPSSKTEWKKVKISLAAYEGQDVNLYFDNKTQFENNLYIDSIFVSTDTVLGLEEIDTANSLYIYPNPAENNITIELKDGYNSLICYNMLGEVVKSVNSISESISNLDVSDLPKGIYLINIQKGDFSFSEKLVIH